MKYPIVLFRYSSAMSVCNTEDELTHCTKPALSRGYYQNLNIVDSTGSCFTVKDAIKTGTIGPLWGFDLFRGQHLRVKLEFKGKKSKLTLDDFKEKILNIFNTDEDFWDSGGNLDELKKKIETTSSSEEIIKFLNETINTEHK